VSEMPERYTRASTTHGRLCQLEPGPTLPNPSGALYPSRPSSLPPPPFRSSPRRCAQQRSARGRPHSNSEALPRISSRPQSYGATAGAPSSLCPAPPSPRSHLCSRLRSPSARQTRRQRALPLPPRHHRPALAPRSDVQRSLLATAVGRLACGGLRDALLRVSGRSPGGTRCCGGGRRLHVYQDGAGDPSPPGR